MINNYFIFVLLLFLPAVNTFAEVSPPESANPDTSQDTTNTNTLGKPAADNSHSPTLSLGSVLPVNNGSVTSAQIINLFRRQSDDWPADMDQQRFIDKAMPLISELAMQQVYNLLLYQYARRHLEKLNISEQTIENIVTEKRGEILAGYGGSEELARTELAKKGTPIDELLEEFKQQVIISGFQELHFSSTLKITRSQMLSYYNAHLRDEFYQESAIQFQLIDIQKDKFSAPDQPVKAARQALGKLRNGIDFARVVGEFSHGFRKSHDGLWRPVAPDSVRARYKPVIEALKDVQPGSITPIIETDEHIFIARLIDYTPASSVPFRQAQKKIKQTLHQRHWRKYRQKLSDDLLKKASVGNIELFIKNTTIAACGQLSK